MEEDHQVQPVNATISQRGQWAQQDVPQDDEAVVAYPDDQDAMEEDGKASHEVVELPVGGS